MATTAVAQSWGTIQDAAEMFKLSDDTIRRMISRGEIEAKRFGPRLIRVNLQSIADSARPLAVVA
ncbi:helix-turn-helix domain-containing protein [Microbacterium sp. CCNWLW134]|uniref:helix-turn-helix domain-containing protein n=1 Tax=Microbacterium sp. CCNWLW134 TaxID=3122064 RepID=UPI00300FC8A9